MNVFCVLLRETPLLQHDHDLEEWYIIIEARKG